uniref:Thiamine biosynthesis protein S n=1 Tax=Schizymenia dubyi TaxID=38368 RepID=A0A1C9C9J1_9FLOR|nr:thiamine biosynthesis protein S [Schizymenia dubyi]AOM65035.1 thiamine biosynthesis protein S [Schizymenia dubyi]
MDMQYNTIFINGDAFNCQKSMSLQDLLIYLNFDINSIAIEYNRELLVSRDFDKIFFNSQDHLEVITIVGGG